jgi:DNA-3-methyladenine glycosylase II
VEHLAPLSPDSVSTASEEQFRAAGQSRGKERTMRALAGAMLDGSLHLDTLESRDDDGALAELTRVKGIGPWTADIYLLTCMGRRDVWPAGDVALQVSAQTVFELETRPTREELVELAEPWRPWRAIAARLLWSHYRHIGVQ